MAAIDKLIQWFQQREGKVTYSMSQRQGPYSYDCSSAVYAALIHAGFLPAGTALGNTETLFALEGTLLQPIQRQEIRPGDLFISGRKGHSLGASGHTGVVLNAQQIIHCTYSRNGIATTPIAGWTASSGQPTYWYRLVAPTTEKVPAARDHDTYRPPRHPFKPLSVGATVTIRKGMSRWQTGERPNFNVIGFKDRILEVKAVKQSYSRRAYLLEHLYSWILEQDLVEAR